LYAAGEHVAIRVYEGYAVVANAQVAHLEGLRFLVDTGSEKTVIDRQIAAQLSLTSTGSGLVTVFNRALRVDRVLLPSLKLGPLRAMNLPVLVEDLEFLRHDLRTSVDGILGMDMLRASSFTIDYVRKKLMFGPAPALNHRVRFDPTLPYVVVPISIGNREFSVMLDTGVPRLVLFQSSVTEDALANSRTVSALSNAGGSFPAVLVPVRDVKFGRKRVGMDRAVIMKAEWREFEGLLGVAGLGARRIAFDFEDGVLTWE
jgi:predicted aspartyl protease